MSDETYGEKIWKRILREYLGKKKEKEFLSQLKEEMEKYWEREAEKQDEE